MAYNVVAIPRHLIKRVLTFAPTGAYINNEDGEGWVALTEYFESKFDAPCSFEETNIKLTGTS